MLKAIIADDDQSVRECLEKLIDWNDIGYSLVAKAANGITAFDAAIETNADVIITDIKMPIMDGTELCKKIREEMSNACIIFLSAYEDFTTAQLALKYNVKEYVLKPIDEEKINYLINILIEHRKLVDSKRFLEHILANHSIDDDILFYLKGNDAEYFISFFSKLDKCTSVDFAVFSTVCFKLITLLYDYFLEIGVSVNVVSGKKIQLGSDLANFKNQHNMLEYTKKLYLDILQFDHHKTTDFHTVLIDRIKQEVKNNYSDSQFGVPPLADELGLSVNYIGKIFKRYTGTTIGAYIHEVRLEESVNLLKDLSKPINDISEMVGFASSGYFTKVFRRKHNMSPSSYRRNIEKIQRSWDND